LTQGKQTSPRRASDAVFLLFRKFSLLSSTFLIWNIGCKFWLSTSTRNHYKSMLHYRCQSCKDTTVSPSSMGFIGDCSVYGTLNYLPLNAVGSNIALDAQLSHLNKLANGILVGLARCAAEWPHMCSLSWVDIRSKSYIY
jgi:hypothetical protein